MKKIFTVLILFATTILFGQSDYTQAINYNNISTGFSIEVANYLGQQPGKTNATVFIQVPYSAIQFVKQGFRYSAEYTITLKITDLFRDSVVYHDIWTEKVTSREFDKTKSNKSFNLSQKSLELNPGNYAIFCLLEDNSSSKKGTINRTTSVRAISDTLDVSDIMLISKVVRGRRGDEIVPNIEGKVTSNVHELAFYFELYCDKDKELPLEIVLFDQMRNKSIKSQLNTIVKPGRNMIYHKLDNVDFTLGKYDLQINSLQSPENNILGRVKTFQSSYKGIPESITDLNKAIDEMIYIASLSSIDSIKSTKEYGKKLEQYVKFWRRLDPSKGSDDNEVMNEYYARVNYANKNFKSYFEGWKTDMGWIFITLGPPDYVNRQPMSMDQKPYEIWTYNEINKTFKFVDETGFGHYRLVNPEYGDWLRYRY